ncbi:hypothetical protein XENOCAPTIV_002023 [Xenoophorus captivus]|uniref:Dynein axonemal assembly factor 4 n=1 Tax=Xenoophorus captivus TaxID=1517983 RepID=A0ABV0QFX1_9TELE
MPLHVTDYTWSQTDSTIHLSVPLKGATVRKVDIVSTEEYLKVHFPPFLFEAFLFEPVDDDRSTARIGNGVAVFTLPKKTCKVWERLMITTDDKETKKEIRERALLKQQQKLSAESKQKGEKQQAEKKYALETMMKLEKEERDRIEKMKEAEREKTTAELAAWQLRQKQKAEEAQQKQNHQIQPAGSTDIPGNRLTDIKLQDQEDPTPAASSKTLWEHCSHVHPSGFPNSPPRVTGLQDYEAALKIDPHNEALQEDAQIIRDIIQGSAGQNETQ